MGEINALHPFREGNGRTQRLYFKYLCDGAGYDLEFSKTQKDALVKADIAAFNKEYTLLIRLLEEIISEKVKLEKPFSPFAFNVQRKR